MDAQYYFVQICLLGKEKLIVMSCCYLHVGTTIGMDIAAGYISTQFTVLWNVPTSGDFNQFEVTYDPYDPTNPNAQEYRRIISVSSLNGAQEGSLLIYGLEPGQLYNVYVQTMLNGIQTDDGYGRISFRTRKIDQNIVQPVYKSHPRETGKLAFVYRL